MFLTTARRAGEPGTFFEAIDWLEVSAPTLAERRETEALFAEATTRGEDSEVIGAFLNGAGSDDGQHTWDLPV